VQVHIIKTRHSYYQPHSKTIGLTGKVYDGNSLTAAAVAIHEAGHALQFNAVSKNGWIGQVVAQIAISIGILGMLHLFGDDREMRRALISACSLECLFAYLLCVLEVDASRRGITAARNMLATEEIMPIRKLLKSAAATYAGAALAATGRLIFVLLSQ